MLDSMQIAVLSTLACFALLFVAYVKSVLGKAAKEQLQKESGSSSSRRTSVVVGNDDDSSNNKAGKARKVSTSEGRGKAGGGGGRGKVAATKDSFSHAWLLTTLKGHSGRVLDLDFSENGKYLASSAEDRSVLIWSCKDFPQKEHKTMRGNVSYDHGTMVRWSPDSKAYVVHRATENAPEVYKINRRDDGSLGNIQSVVSFPKRHDTDVVGLGFACTGRFVMTCSDKTTLVLWSIRGEELAAVDTYHMSTYCAKISPCGRFVASSGFTPDVKVWEVKFTKSGDFDKMSRAFELTGHASGVFSFDFSADSSRMVTLSKDGKWRLFDTKVEFSLGQDPSLLTTGTFNGATPSSIVALSPDSQVVVIADGQELSFFSAESGDKIGAVSGVHAEQITKVVFDKESRWVVTSGDKHIRVFHNVPGFKLRLRDLRVKLPKATTGGMRDRLEQQISETEAVLRRVGEKEL